MNAPHGGMAIADSLVVSQRRRLEVCRGSGHDDDTAYTEYGHQNGIVGDRREDIFVFRTERLGCVMGGYTRYVGSAH